MVSPEIIARINKVIPDFKALQISQPYADEILLKVTPLDFKELCLTLHKILACPVMMLFASDERKERKSFVINCVFLDSRNSQWIIVSMDIPQETAWFDSLSRIIHSASLFEREIWEMFGVKPLDNHDLRRLKLHDEIWPQGQFPLRKDFRMMQEGDLSDYKFARVEGEGILEVPVGPVHAGIIGPGHFRFSVAGEPIINLELRLGFTHRGVEKLFEDKIYTEAVGLSERVSGDSSFAHSLAFALAAEKIFGASVPAQAAIIRGVFLELERMYNHVNDIGGMATDVGFSFPQAIASVIKETILQLNEKLGANRYLKNINIVGGVTQDIDEDKRRLLLDSLKRLKYDFNELVKILNSSVSFMDRVDNTGVLRRQTAQDLGVVGLVARASGIPTDLRKFFPGVYSQAKFKMITQESGDVLARLGVRISEFKESIRLIEAFSGKLVKSAGLSVTAQPREGSGLGYAEGWRGPVLYWLQADHSGLVKRCKIVDASFLNWQGLSYAVLGNIIPDFPLCNKSFDLSYSGNDL
jgi:Ni,Fe-hydrogenase III large subunit/Ni,Fe-hydrogenase III component G